MVLKRVLHLTLVLSILGGAFIASEQVSEAQCCRQRCNRQRRCRSRCGFANNCGYSNCGNYSTCNSCSGGYAVPAAPYDGNSPAPGAPSAAPPPAPST